MRKYYLFITLLLSFSALAQSLDDQFKTLLTKYGIAPLKEQAYCYSENGVLNGFQTQKLQRIASITKLFTTFLISETVNLNRTYATKVYLSKDSMHIEGGRDPYFEEEKMLLLFKALNELKHTSFKKITFTSDFLFYDVALGEYEEITPEKTRARFAYFTNPKNKSFVSSTWAKVRKFAEEEGVDLPVTAPFVRASSVSVSAVNPLLGENPFVLTHTSLPLHLLLKSMNVQSKNLVAENLFRQGSRLKSLETLLQENGISSESFKIYNGSGLPIINGSDRLDNLASCETLMRVFALLSESLARQKFDLSEIMAVSGGKDRGSFKERFLQFPKLFESVISKTGTLKHTSSLGGFLLNGAVVPFAILNHTTDTGSAKKFQDEFVSEMFDFIGPPRPMIYQKISIFPWTTGPFFKSLL